MATSKQQKHRFPKYIDEPFCAHCPHCEAQQTADPVKRALRAFAHAHRMINTLTRQSYEVAEKSEVESTQIVGSNTNVALSEILDEMAVLKVQLERIKAKGVRS